MNTIAGADITAVALSSVFYSLLKNPTTFQKQRDEIDPLSHARAQSVYAAWEEIQQMPYLHAVSMEALEIHPPTPMHLGNKERLSAMEQPWMPMRFISPPSIALSIDWTSVWFGLENVHWQTCFNV
jgi:Cytochrome P450